MRILIQLVISFAIALISILVYFQIVGFSAALPIPDFMLEYVKVHGSPSAIYDWGFYFLTLSVPFSFYALVVYIFSSRWLPLWVATLGIFGAAVYVRTLHYGFIHWISMFILIIMVFGVFWFITRNNALNSPSAGTAKSAAR